MSPLGVPRRGAVWFTCLTSWLWVTAVATGDEQLVEHPAPFGVTVSCPSSWQVQKQTDALLIRTPTGGRAVVRHWATRRDLETLAAMLETEARKAGWTVRERAERLLRGERTGRMWIFDVPESEDARGTAIRQLVYVIDTPQGTVLLSYAEQSDAFDRALAQTLLERLSFSTATAANSEAPTKPSAPSGLEAAPSHAASQSDSRSTAASTATQPAPRTTTARTDEAAAETEAPPSFKQSEEERPRASGPHEPKPADSSATQHAELAPNGAAPEPGQPRPSERTTEAEPPTPQQGQAPVAESSERNSERHEETEPKSSASDASTSASRQASRAEPTSTTATAATDEFALHRRAEAELQAIDAAIRLFRTDTGTYPDTLDELLQSDNPVANGPYLTGEKETILLDPWGRPYIYKLVGSGKPAYVIGSFGADGKPGGEGAAADLFNREIPLDLLQGPDLPADLAERVRTDRLVLSAALRRFRKDTGSWPATLDELIRSSRKGWRGPYVLGGEQGLLDPWGRAYVYEPPAGDDQPFRLGTFGADGAPGGYGEATDVFDD